ncbi:MAG: hypothetical protein AAF551_11830 [Bacteroidota bacterium]
MVISDERHGSVVRDFTGYMHRYLPLSFNNDLLPYSNDGLL